MESILQSIKKLLSIPLDVDEFDNDIIMHINSVFFTLMQLGVVERPGFSITGVDEQWSDINVTKDFYESIKTYVYLKVRLLFDPPTNSTVIEMYKQQIQEYEWRLNVETEHEKDDQNG